MPVTVDWYDKSQAILLLQYSGDDTMEQVEEGLARLEQLVREVPASVRYDIIIDLLHSSYTPPVGVMWVWKQETEQRESDYPNWGLSVYVSNSKIRDAYFKEGIKTSASIRKHSRQATSLKEAQQIILHSRQQVEVC